MIRTGPGTGVKGPGTEQLRGRGEDHSRLHVAHVITRLDMGGCAQNTLLTLLHLPPEHYELTLITGPSPALSGDSPDRAAIEELLDRVRCRGVRIIEAPHLIRSVSPRNDVRALWSLFRILRRLSPDGVHTHTSKAGFIGRIAARAARTPWVVHTPHGHVFWGHFPPLPSAFFFHLEKVVCKITHHLIALTHGEADDYRRLEIMAPEDMSVIPSGVPLERFRGARSGRKAMRKEMQLPEEARVVGFVGWLWPVKGVQYLLEAMVEVMRRDRKAYLLIVGQGRVDHALFAPLHGKDFFLDGILRDQLDAGEEQPGLRARAETAGFSRRVLFTGWRPDVPFIMGGLDLLVLPSLNEGMGRVLVEAMAAGLPVIGTNVGGIPDLVKHGENGLLAPPANAAALREAILAVLGDAPWSEAMGRRGEEISRGFSVDAMINGIQSVYARMAEKHGKPSRGMRR